MVLKATAGLSHTSPYGWEVHFDREDLTCLAICKFFVSVSHAEDKYARGKFCHQIMRHILLKDFFYIYSNTQLVQYCTLLSIDISHLLPYLLVYVILFPASTHDCFFFPAVEKKLI